MEAIRFEGVTKDFVLDPPLSAKDFVIGTRRGRPRAATYRAVDSLSFSVNAGESVALLGSNGSGKSTTLKMLAGVMRPTAGVIRARGRVAPLLELGSGFHPDLTGAENVYLNGAVLGIRRSEIRSRFQEIMDFAEIGEFANRPVRFYSSGMVVRLGFAVAATLEPEILLVDEVLAVGDGAFQKRSMERMQRFRSQGVTVMLVTHDLAAARAFCDRALVLDRGRLVFDGDMDEVTGVV